MVEHIYQLLIQSGHDILLIVASTDVLEVKRFYKIQTFIRVSTGSGQNISTELDTFRPEIILSSNTFPNIGDSWMQNRTEPIISYLHNFRYICSASTLFRQGKDCELCPTKSSLYALKYRCYRDSYVATLPLVLRQITPKKLRHELNVPKVYVALSERAKAKFIEHGFPEKKINVLPNFIPDRINQDTIQAKYKNRWVYAGRITPEKGLSALLQSLPNDIHLDIYGDGHERPKLEQKYGNQRIRFFGRVPQEEISAILPSYYGAFFSSLWNEGMPLVFLEYIQAGLPVISTKSNTVGDLVDRIGNGVTVSALSIESISEAVSIVHSKRTIFQERSLKAFRQEYSQAKWVERFDEMCGHILAENSMELKIDKKKLNEN